MRPRRTLARFVVYALGLVSLLVGVPSTISGCDRGGMRLGEGARVPQRTVDRILDQLNELRGRTDLPLANHFQLECDFSTGFHCRFASVQQFVRPTLSYELRTRASIQPKGKVRIRCIRPKGSPSSRCEIDRGGGFVILPVIKQP